MDNSVEYFKYLDSLKSSEIKKRFTLLGEGISRKVYDLNNNLVLKVAKGNEGYYQNKVECYVYNNANSNQIKYLCPIIWFSPRIIIMKKAEPLSKKIKSRDLDLKSIRPEKDAYIHINSIANDFFLFYEDIVSPSSWGKLDGINVLIDYGCTSNFGDLYYNMLFSL